MLKINNILNYKFCFIFLFLIGILFRIYNINFDDLWIDEISTFWIANPSINILTSYNNNSTLELQPVLFNFIVRCYYSIFGYSDYNGRYISSFFSILSIITTSYLSWLISKNKSYLLTAFLLSFNVYLITYSQELRVYSVIFFFISLSILFYIHSLKKENFFNIFFFSIFVLFSIFLHPFSLILLFSIFFHIILIFIFKKKYFRKIIISIVGILFISIIYYIIHLRNLIPETSNAYFFLKNPDLKFITNLYFSKFFGSRIIGIIFLILFLFAIKRAYKKIINLEYVSFLLILFSFSYIFPIIYGFLFHPIIQPKYIIFTIIPIILIITDFIFELKRSFRNKLIIFIIIITLGNSFTEQNIKQFYTDRIPHKPEINKALKLISNSKYKDYLIKVEPYDDLKKPWTLAVENYLNFLNKKKNLQINYINQLNKILDQVWVICIHDLNHFGCNDKKFQEIDKIELNRLTLSLVSVK